MGIGTYKKYRKANIKLNRKINKNIDDERYDLTLRLLKLSKVDMLDDAELARMNDFLAYEPFYKNQSIVNLNPQEAANKREKNMWKAMDQAYTSLFDVVEVLPKEGMVILNDLLNPSEEIRLMDMGLSTSLDWNKNAKILIFTRIIDLGDCCMTSGCSFVFNKKDEKYLLRKYKKMNKKPLHPNENVSRFIHFFLLNKAEGVNVFFV